MFSNVRLFRDGSGAPIDSSGQGGGESETVGTTKGRSARAHKYSRAELERVELFSLSRGVRKSAVPLDAVRQKSVRQVDTPGQFSSNSSNIGQMSGVTVAKLEPSWCDDLNAVYVHADAPLFSPYAELEVDGRSNQSDSHTGGQKVASSSRESGIRKKSRVIVKVLKRNDAQLDAAHIAQGIRTGLGLALRDTVTLTDCRTLPDHCWDSFSLHILNFYKMNDGRNCVEPDAISKSQKDIAGAFIKDCHSSKSILVDGQSYYFGDGVHLYHAQVRLRSSEAALDTGGLLASRVQVCDVTVGSGALKNLKISGATLAVDSKKLATKFEFNGESYGIGGVNSHIKQFVSEFIMPRLMSSTLQETIQCKVPRGGILSGPPGTGKTLFISVLESLLRENGFSVSVKIVSGPEVFGRYVGQSEENVRAIFAHGEDPKTMRLILIDEIDSMLPCRGGLSDTTGSASKVVNQFLTCLDGVEKKDNLVVFGTTNRPDLIDPAVMRPGRMSMTMQFSLPNASQRLQILKIQARGFLSDDQMEELAGKTAGFTGAELGALTEKAKVSALRKQQGLGDEDMYFCPQTISRLEALEVAPGDFEWALTQIKPQFGKSHFMPLEGKSLSWSEYPAGTAGRLKNTLDEFRQDNDRSTLRLLITGPGGSGKSTMAALVQREFGAFCSYVPAVDVVKSRDRRLSVVDAFSQRSHHQSSSNKLSPYCVVLDDYDTMINFDGIHYDQGMVSIMDAYTKQSLQGDKEGKLLVLVTATEHEYQPKGFLPRLFPEKYVFRTRLPESSDSSFHLY